MDWITFTSNLIGQILSWPVAVIVVAILFRKPIAERIKDVRRIKTKHFEADFGEQLEKASQTLSDLEAKLPREKKPVKAVQPPPPKSREELQKELIELIPNAAILDSWRNVEWTLNHYFESRGIEPPKSGQTILGHLDYDPNFPPQLVSAYQELRLLRNRAAHAHENVTPAQAKEFEALADRLTYALMQAAELSRGM
ncbi:hypothetical protein [Vibrio gazogenes]|uniref:DUF4145 domain-containing protein n=1 Tax=Vibrio gazogenes DSM 21264 = NBRC 103151 TaxID=1123492 RepID=A0A1M4TKV8_VIBGA|nr:hypothetical protein [Vibrio gazogenes]USP16123.1 hypothetical protein MKS89_17205 [Vibrio gazogenes]SHE45068.1 hypothetical protein SAMN02745781_00344 [Vibrio gazogenes DSM 21264] [Vibrio gazogenes DSM 21264 = NBRC 103151]SJN59008.1 hypothetical protein BQ6471_03282 [Vibrio gazogenes]